MTRDELAQLVEEVRTRKTEFDSVEVKAARDGTPKRLYEALSALANRPGGGVILFRLDEQKDFALLGVGDAHWLQEEVTHVAAGEMEPALRPEFVLEDIDGDAVMAGFLVDCEDTCARRGAAAWRP